MRIACGDTFSPTYYRDFRATVEEVFRFDPEDTLLFRVRLENTDDKEVIYQPQRLAVRVGSDVYYASISDASGIIPPKASTAAFFAIAGTPRGGRANLRAEQRSHYRFPARACLPKPKSLLRIGERSSTMDRTDERNR